MDRSRWADHAQIRAFLSVVGRYNRLHVWGREENRINGQVRKRLDPQGGLSAITDHPARDGITPMMDGPNIVFFGRDGPKPCTMSLPEIFHGDCQTFPSSTSLRKVFWKFHRYPRDPALAKMVFHFQEFFAEALSDREKGYAGITVADPEDVVADYSTAHPASPISPHVQAA